MAAKPIFAGRARIQGWLSRLEEALKADDRAAALAVLDEAIRIGTDPEPAEEAAAHTLARVAEEAGQ